MVVDSPPTRTAGIAQQLCRVERAVILLVTVLLPLAYAPGLLNDPYDMPKVSLLIVSVCLAFSLRLAAAVLGAPSRGLRIALAPAAVLGIAFLASWLVSDYKVWSLLGMYLRYAGLVPYLAVFTFGVLAAEAFAGRGRLLLHGLLGGAFIVALFGIIQMVFLGSSLATTSDTSYVTSTLGHSNFLAGYLAITLPLALGVWGTTGRSRIGMAATTVIATCLLFTMSQGGWSAGIAGIAVFAGLTAERGSWKQRLGLAVAAFAMVASVASVLVSLPLPHPTVQLPSFFSTAVSRGFLWEAAADMGMERPLLGWGPNVHAIEGPLHRVLENALFLNFIKGDDPHSVPLAMFANLGAVGVAAWVFLFAWTKRKWQQLPTRSPIQNGAAAALVAYLVQSLASIDEPTLRFVLWTLVAAIAATAAPAQPVHGTRAKPFHIMVAGFICIAGVASAAASVAVLPLADYRVRQGVLEFGEGDVSSGSSNFRAALRLRPDTEYKRRYAAALNEAALSRRFAGAHLIAEMKRTLSYLNEFPDAQALAAYSKFLNRWSLFEPRANIDALTIARRAQELDPFNPLLAVDIADILLQLGRADDASEALRPFVRLLTDDFPEYSDRYTDFWATVAIVQAKLENPVAARSALQRVTNSGSCRQLLAHELLKSRSERDPAPAWDFLCPPTLIRVLTE